MKITYFIRDPRKGNYSLEKIFLSIGEIIAQEHDVTYFYVNPDKSKWWNIREAARNQGDVNHITGDVNWLAFGLDKKRTLLTAHDLGHYVNTLKGIKRIVYGYIWWKWPLKKVAAITAISNYTKSQLIKNFKIQSDKITTIYNPLSQKFKEDEYFFHTSKPSILQVGSMQNKNVDRLIEAIEDIPGKLILLRMKNNELASRLRKLRIDHEFYSGLSDLEVIKLYKSIDILYFASTYEGFGLPIIEAQAIGRPVITSTIPPMPEVAGEGAHFVDPFNTKKIKEGILKIINEREYRQKLIKAGFKNVKRFEAERIAQQYLNLYKQILEA